MIDIKQLREKPDEVKRRLGRRGAEAAAACGRLLDLDRRRRAALTAVEAKKAEKNAASKAIGAKKQKGEDAAVEQAAMRRLGEEISRLDTEIREIEAELEKALLWLPNVPADDMPDSGNRTMKNWGEPRPAHKQPHWEIATALALVDFERGVKVAATRFYALKGLGARLERSLIAFMLDLHVNRHGYTEVMPPFLVSLASMQGTGQYPKFTEEYFTCERDGLALAPTAEVPVTNLHRDEILSELPIKYCAWTPCFRREAGAAGKDTRGLIRVHQFNKVELVRFEKPEAAPAALEELTAHAEAVLEGLELPYRRVLLAADDLGFASARTYDLEVWMPGLDRFVEVSSCSWFTDFQSRRMKIRFRREKEAKPELVHTLNGSGLAVGRTFAALLENGLQEDGSVRLPEALKPYMGEKFSTLNFLR